jgi:hypothetical protein
MRCGNEQVEFRVAPEQQRSPWWLVAEIERPIRFALSDSVSQVREGISHFDYRQRHRFRVSDLDERLPILMEEAGAKRLMTPRDLRERPVQRVKIQGAGHTERPGHVVCGRRLKTVQKQESLLPKR